MRGPRNKKNNRKGVHEKNMLRNTGLNKKPNEWEHRVQNSYDIVFKFRDAYVWGAGGAAASSALTHGG